MKTITAKITVALKYGFGVAVSQKGQQFQLHESQGPVHTEEGLYFPYMNKNRHFAPDFYPVVGEMITIALNKQGYVMYWGLGTSWRIVEKKIADRFKVVQYRLMLSKQDGTAIKCATGTAEQLTKCYARKIKLEYHPDFVGTIFQGEFFYWEKKVGNELAGVSLWSECADPREMVQVSKTWLKVQRCEEVAQNVEIQKVAHKAIQPTVKNKKDKEVLVFPKRNWRAPICLPERFRQDTTGLML